jgi:hypothetical protein
MKLKYKSRGICLTQTIGGRTPSALGRDAEHQALTEIITPVRLTPLFFIRFPEKLYNGYGEMEIRMESGTK